jgi:hypothetical protein
VSELPPPAPQVAPAAPSPVVATGRPGTLSTPWRLVLVICWTAVILAQAAVWKTSEELGIGTWWLGTRSEPTNQIVRLLPFAIAAAAGVAAAYNLRRAWWASLAAALALVAFSLPDFSRSTGLALVELVIGLAALVVTAAAWTGRYRTGTSDAPETPETSGAAQTSGPGGTSEVPETRER